MGFENFKNGKSQNPIKIPKRAVVAGAILHTQLTAGRSVDALLLTLSSPPSHRAPEGPTTLSQKDFIHISASLFTLCLPPPLKKNPTGDSARTCTPARTHTHTQTEALLIPSAFQLPAAHRALSISIWCQTTNSANCSTHMRSTYDAVSVSHEADAQNRRTHEQVHTTQHILSFTCFNVKNISVCVCFVNGHP